jgi:hypothetical protein
MKIRPTPRGHNHTFLPWANTLALGKGKGTGSGLTLDVSPLRDAPTDAAAAAADGRSPRASHSCESLLRGDRGTSGSW